MKFIIEFIKKVFEIFGFDIHRKRKLAPRWLSTHKRGVSVSRINKLLQGLNKTRRYLEIGVQFGHTFEAVKADLRVAVEPYPEFDIKNIPKGTQVWAGDSDSFFASYKGPRFSLIFIDGLHEAGQTYKDLVNSLNILEVGGIILIDDVWPSDEASSLPEEMASVSAKEELGITHWNWFGDVYKVVGAIKLFHLDLELKLIGSAQDKIQAVVWRKSPAKDSALTVLPENLQQISEWTYADFFGSKLYRFEPSADSDPEIIVNATRSQRF